MTPNLYADQQQQQQRQRQYRHYDNDRSSQSSSNSYYPDQHYPHSRSGYEDLFDIDKQVKELDRQLAIVRSSPPKIIHDGKEVTVQLDMSHFVPQEIEITITGKMMIVKAMATVYLNEKNSVDKIFKRKFAFPSSILHDTVTTTIDRFYLVTIKAKRI